MIDIDSFTYVLKERLPWAYNILFNLTMAITVLRHGRAKRRALAQGRIAGVINQKSSIIRPLTEKDLSQLISFFGAIPENYLVYFRPHSLGRSGLRKILRSSAVSTYGLFIDERLIAYGLIKLFPTRNAYIGRVISPQFSGQGLGKFLSNYLCWQSWIMNLTPRSTIHENNLPSLNSHRAVRRIYVAEKLPNGYLQVVYPRMESDQFPPELNL